MKIVIDEFERTEIFDDRGRDILKILADHSIYLSDIVLRMTPGGVSLQAKISSCSYVIETPNSLMNIIEALHSVEE
jgi:hypothetical protein